MKILVDADACPVIGSILAIASNYNIPVTLFTDTNHVLNFICQEIIVVDAGKDSVDIALANKITPGDIVVTQDYGLGCIALAKKAYSINQNGLIYTENNIDSLLFQRHLSNIIRKSGSKTSNPKKRTKTDDAAFSEAFSILCENALKT